MSILLPIQFVLLVFIVFAASRAVLQFRGGMIRFGAMLFWLGIWTVAIIAIFYPETTTSFAKLLGIGRGVDVILYISIAILFYLVFRLHIYVEDLRTEISQLIRELSLTKIQDNKKSGKK